MGRKKVPHLSFSNHAAPVFKILHYFTSNQSKSQSLFNAEVLCSSLPLSLILG